MRLQNGGPRERLAAQRAAERALASVHPAVVLHMVAQFERLAAELALERTIACMRRQVADQRTHVWKRFAAEFAHCAGRLGRSRLQRRLLRIQRLRQLDQRCPQRTPFAEWRHATGAVTAASLMRSARDNCAGRRQGAGRCADDRCCAPNGARMVRRHERRPVRRRRSWRSRLTLFAVFQRFEAVREDVSR